jgi:hypothetical protein
VRPGVLLALLALGCGQSGGPPPRATTRPEAVADDGPAFRPLVAQVSWTAEEPFLYRRPANAYRAAEYTVRDEPGAVLAVFHFGGDEGGGGTVAENVERWRGQFEGRPEAELREADDGGLPVTRVALRGTFIGRRGDGTPMAPQLDWRLLGAIVEGPEGLVFFKLTGPERSVTLAEDAFDELLRSVHPE